MFIFALTAVAQPAATSADGPTPGAPVASHLRSNCRNAIKIPGHESTADQQENQTHPAGVARTGELAQDETCRAKNASQSQGPAPPQENPRSPEGHQKKN
jgi:hypothetical protein